MASVVSNYARLQAMWEDTVDIVRDTDTKARIRGITAQMESLSFFFFLGLCWERCCYVAIFYVIKGLNL